MDELTFVVNMVEEQLVKGNLRWLANFNEVRRDYSIGDVIFPIYAAGGLQERGFFLSKIYSVLVTPKYKVNFFLYMSQQTDPKTLRNIILSFKNKFGPDDWVFLALVQNEPFEKQLKKTVTEMEEKTIGIAAYSLASKEAISSNNVLGKGLRKQLNLTEAKFEAFDLVNYLKSFTVVFALGASLLVVMSLSGLRQAIQPLTLALMAVFSIIVGHTVYKKRYHARLLLSSGGFQLREGNTSKDGKWSDYDDISIFITPQRETYLRLSGSDRSIEKFDIPVSRAGISRVEAYNAIRQLVRKKQAANR